MNLHDAMSQIADIRQQVARAQSFRGYRSATTALTGIIAIVTAWVQSMVLPVPHQRLYQSEYADSSISRWDAIPASAGVFQIDLYLYLWFAAAMLSMVIVGIEMGLRVRKSQSDLQRDLTLTAVEQFVPSLVVGLLLTIVIVQFAFASVWMLPGLWMLLFGLGIFASRRVLPKYSSLVGAFYLMAGLFVLALQKQAGLHAWTMGAVFGVGQTAAAGVLWIVERRSEQ